MNFREFDDYCKRHKKAKEIVEVLKYFYPNMGALDFGLLVRDGILNLGTNGYREDLTNVQITPYEEI